MKREFYDTLLSPGLWLVCALLAALPLFLSGYHLQIVTLALTYAALASAWNIVGGMGGMLSLAHSLFVGIGGMCASALLIRCGINMWVGSLGAALVAAGAGCLIAWIGWRFRLGHLLFALITLAFAEMASIVAMNCEFLGGASGLFLPPDKGSFIAFEFGGMRGTYWVMLMLAAGCVLSNLAVLNLPLGYRLRAVRDNADAAQAIGVPLLRTQMVAMVVSAFLTSIVGSVYARYLSFVDPQLLVSPTLTVEIVLFATVGGLGRPFGPALGALILLPVGEVLRGQFGGALPGLHYFIYGLVVIVVVRFAPRGVLPTIAAGWSNFRARRADRTMHAETNTGVGITSGAGHN